MKKLMSAVLALALVLSLSVAAFAAPEGLESLAIVGKGIPGVGEWKPEDPAGDMTEVSDNIYVKELDMTAGETMNFKFAGNDAWVDAFNFGSATIVLGEVADLECAGHSTDMAFTAEKDMKIKITVDLSAFATGEGAATVKVEEVVAGGNDEGNKDEGNKDEGNKDEGNKDEGNKDEGNKDEGNKPENNGTPSEYRVTGNADFLGQWNPAFAGGQMKSTKTADVYEITFKGVAKGNYEIKVTKNGTWDGAVGSKDGQNYKFTVSQKCDVTISFNAKTNTISVKGEGCPPTGDVNMTGIVIMMVVASTAAVALVYGKKKFF